MPKSTQQFQTIRTEGALLPPDILQRIASLKVDGVRPADYHLPEGFQVNDAITQSWDILKKHWKNFKEARERLPESEHGTSVTNERWLLPLFKELEYGRLITSPSPQIEDRSYPIERFYNHTPIHLIGCNLPMDRRTKGARGAATSSPHSMMQEFLNRSDQHQWGFLSNGRQLRILRDNLALSRQAYVEFDLEGMMDGEVYGDFVLLWLLCHQSRVEAERVEGCWLELWSKLAREEGTRVLNNLRAGVTRAIELLGQGFIAHPHNNELRRKLQESGTLTNDNFYRQLLRIVYRLLFLFVAEDRQLLHPPNADESACELYDTYYSTRRLRDMAFKLRGSKHSDLWHSLSLIFDGLHRNTGLPELGLPALGSFLWNPEKSADLLGPAQINAAVPSPPDKGERSRVKGPSELHTPVLISNDHLLAAIRTLAYVEQDRVLRDVDYRNLGTDEFGSVYESLLELHPTVHVEAKSFDLGTAAGNERKTSGSYYTPDSLVQCLLDSALDPVVAGRLKGKKGKDAEDAILSIKVCDPACGSGHFLISAAHRLARHLARIRTGEAEPGPEEYQRSLRDVISRCIYGVDINPMAVELCKVSLWMESLDPGRALSFLDHHIKVGNSLLGVTPKLLEDGIPDDAFNPIEGDVKTMANALKSQNKKERAEYRQASGKLQKVMFGGDPFIKLGNLPSEFTKLSISGDDSIAESTAKERRFAELVSGADYQNARLLADAWCAVFVWQKDTSDLGKMCPTERDFRKIENNPYSILPHVKSEVQRLAGQSNDGGYQFFHWHLEFPQVFQLAEHGKPDNEQTGWRRGFDVVLGNPPWERIKLQEQEYFDSRHEKIATARNAAARKKVISALPTTDPELWEQWSSASRHAHGVSHFARNSGRYPLCGRGDINVYTLFTEHNWQSLAPRGRAGFIIPSGIATDDTTKDFFQAITNSKSLHSLWEFENEGFFTAGKGHMLRFALTTFAGIDDPAKAADFMFQGHAISELADPDRHFTLSPEDMLLINPNTGTCPIFRTKRDADIALKIYRRAGILWREGDPDGNPWGLKFMAMFHMANDSELFRTESELRAAGWQLQRNCFIKDGKTLLPLYEAKMAYMYNHRSGTFAHASPGERPHRLPTPTEQELADPNYVVQPFYWVDENDVNSKLSENWDRGWLLGWRDVTDARASVRTVVAAILPRVAVGHKMPLAFSATSPTLVACAYANLSSFALDYVARQKVGGLSLTYFILKQLPVLKPSNYQKACPWNTAVSNCDWVAERVIELCCTAFDMCSFAADCGMGDAPYIWNVERRFQLQCELDAAFFHLYGLSKDDVEYIMETFPVVRRNDERKYGYYRTKQLILEIYDQLAEATSTAQPYISPLGPAERARDVSVRNT